MGLTTPAALLLLLAVAALAALSYLTLRWQAGAQRRLSGGSTGALLAGAASQPRRAFKAGLTVAALVLLVLAVAGPYAGAQPTQLKPQRTDVMVLLDVSQSMLAQDVQPSRFELAKREVGNLLDTMDSDRFGLMVFAGNAVLRVPFTLDYAAARTVLQSATIEGGTTPGSALADALRTGISVTRQSDAPRKGIVLIGDGEDPRGQEEAADLANAIETAKLSGIPVYTLGVGTAAGGTISVPNPRGGGVTLKRDQAGQVVTTRLEERSLRDIATQTGGAYQAATASGREIQRLYDGARTAGPATKPDEREARLDTFTPWLALAAFFLLMVEIIIPERPSVRRGGASPVLALLPAAVLVALPACTPGVDEAFTLNQQGIGLYDQGRYDKALEAFRQAQVRRPDLPELDFNAGAGLYKQGQDERALREWQRATQTEDGSLRNKAQFNSGDALFLLERYEDAIEAYKRVLRDSPSDMDAKVNLELALRKLQPPPQQTPPPPQGGQAEQPRGDQDSGPQGQQQQPPQNQQQGQQGPTPQQPGPPRPGQQQPSPQQGQQPSQGQQGGQQQQGGGQQQGQGQQGQQGQQQRDPGQELREALRAAGSEYSIEEALRILEALRGRERQMQEQYNRPADQQQPGQPAQRPARDW